MTRFRPFIVIASVLCLSAAETRAQQSEAPANMSFFVTSAGRGFGGNLGGLAGADAQCQRLAAAVGRDDRVWRAYLSAPATAGAPAVNARDRIGHGPWFNAKGVQIASSVDDLHSANNAITRETARNEKGVMIGPGRHDIMTGSNEDGTLSMAAADTTCRGWTSGDSGSAMLGHHNRYGGGTHPDSWNSAHLSRGCSQDALRASLGDGLFYCFAVD